MFALRYDQMILTAMGGLIGLTVIFAGGVERGKQLARSERLLLARQESTSAAREATSAAVEPSPEAAPKTNPPASASPSREPEAPASEVPSKETAPSQALRGKSRYAIQVVTYSRPQLAKQELERLRARGEQAFIVMRNSHTIVYVGPFPSKDNAAKKVADLRGRYHDCFVKAL